MEEEEPLQPNRNRPRHRTYRHLTDRDLQELESKTPEEIVLRLASDGGGLDALVKKQAISNHTLLLLMRLVDKGFGMRIQQSQYENLKSIVDIMLDTEFLNYNLFRFCQGRSGGSDDENRLIIRATLQLINFAMQTFPRLTMPKVYNFTTLLTDSLRYLGDETLNQQLDRFQKEFQKEEKRSQKEDYGAAARGIRVSADEERGEENFRELQLIPTHRDLTSDEHIFVRRNRLESNYENLEEYLDVQFRLFRADFIIPLRESIERFLGTHEADTGRDSGRGVRVYRDVQIVRPVCTDRDLTYRLSFDVNYFKEVDWRRSQRLKYGSLLCLSSDSFQTYMCAVVHEHDPNLLSNGLVDVVFILERPELEMLTDIPRDMRFVMIESPAYFEAYRHVLQGLKNLNDNNFPFIRYIVHCDARVNPPQYLQRRGNVRYDFRPLLNDSFVIKDETDSPDELGNVLGDQRETTSGGVNVMSEREWPSQRDLKLDDTQYQALYRTLTREFALIQGPPGTGKTYLGLKIMKMLLHNSGVWNDPGQKRPLLVVCYTNHALDQFLEGVLDFFQGNLVRVGAQSKSERLKEKSLTHYRTRAKANRNIPMEIHEARVRARLELQRLKLDIHEKAAMLEIVEQEIVKEEFLKEFINQRAMQDFKRSLGRSGEDSAVLKWLSLDLLHERLLYQAEHGESKLPSARQMRANTSRASSRAPDYCEDEFEDDEEEVEIVEVSESLRDGTHARRLDADDDDDDDFDNFEFDLDDVVLAKEETEMDRLRRRQREMESETRQMRFQYVALDVSGFCREEEVVGKGSKEKEVADNLRKLEKQQKRRLQTLQRSLERMTLEEADQVQNIWKLKLVDKWRLYRHWTDLFCRQLKGEIRENERTYFDKTRKYREILDQEDRSILQNATVIGLTTTAAARYQAILHAIGPRVIVVEEAAEVFEAHVIATLSQECQHLILIGDHKQLRPNPTVYDLAKKCNLDLSLFERMVHNDFQFDCLGHQHRMRPEISWMIKIPELYPNLQDDEVVTKYPPVKGMKHNVYYVCHSHPENRDEETKSYSNWFEAEFVVALCAYLLKQDYNREQITILTPYSGQVHAISSQMPKRQFDGVRVSSVDNFQGEENDIILLSLVRSNNDNDIGFLKFDNRICVALSRAKMGMYVLGNFEVLQQNGTLLKKVCERANGQKIMGDALPLACQNHPRKEILVKDAKDFKQAPEGGCRERCDVRLTTCGHQCARTCHPSVDHSEIICPLPCVRQCSKCHQRCDGLDHACCEHTHCTRLTDIIIPRCGHSQRGPCGLEPMRVDCKAPCQLLLPCGHQCQSTCGQPCSRQCQAMVTVDNQNCGHQYEVKCSERTDATCSVPCGQELVCGHCCKGSCGDCRKGRLHVPCEERCRKILVCGHDCAASCCQCPPCSRSCENRCSHSRCDRSCGTACVSCAMNCDWQCDHKRCTKTCGDVCDRDRCNQPCDKKLSDCGHPCIGLCGETCPPICRICDPELLADSVFGEPEKDDRFVVLEDCCHVLEVTSLDQWVDSGAGSDAGDGEGGDHASDAAAGEEAAASEDVAGGEAGRLVKLPDCPQCRTPIRRNLRYGNVVKRALKEIEIIKRRCRGNQEAVDDLYRKVERAKGALPMNLKPQVEALFTKRQVICESLLATQFYQITVVKDVNQLLRQVSSATTRWPDVADMYKVVQEDLEHFIAWTLRPRDMLSDQERFDVRQELQRLQILVHLLHCQHFISAENVDNVEPRVLRRLAACIRQLMTMGPVAENELEDGRQLTELLKDVVVDPYTVLTDEEREEIVKAVKLPTGSWYACPKGHYYVIGECGRPTEAASCPECRCAIGGENHALASGNRQAPEFDDAKGPVWSVETDLEYALRLQEEEFNNWH